MAKTILIANTSEKQETVKFCLENDEMTLLEVKQWHYTGYEEEEFFWKLKHADLLDKKGMPAKKATENRLIYFKEGEPHVELDWGYFPEGRRLVVGDHEYLSEYLEFMDSYEEFMI